LDQPTERFLSDLLGLFVILIVTVLSFWVYGSSGILVGGGLALVVWAASIALFRKG
jgi:hypothetical protein